MTDKPPAKVVALVPAWNAEQFIERTLESLARQNYPNFGVLISDDASTDNTASICQEFVKRDGRFVLERQDKNIGWLANSNFLLHAAEADYLLFASHDDVLLPDFISRCVSALESNTRAIIAYSDMVTFYYHSGDREIGYCTELDGISARVERCKRMLWRTNHWWALYRGVFRAEAVAHIGSIRRNLAGEFMADWSWLVHMVLLGEAVRVPDILVEKYYREKSLSRTWNYSPRHHLAALLGCSREIYLARLPVRESLRLYATVARSAVQQMKKITVRQRRAKI